MVYPDGFGAGGGGVGFEMGAEAGVGARGGVTVTGFETGAGGVALGAIAVGFVGTPGNSVAASGASTTGGTARFGMLVRVPWPVLPVVATFGAVSGIRLSPAYPAPTKTTATRTPILSLRIFTKINLNTY
jgi:hypothetical protein